MRQGAAAAPAKAVAAGIVLAGTAASGMIIAASIMLAGPKARLVTPPAVIDTGVAAPASEVASIVAAPHLVFLSKGIDANYTALSVAPLQAPAEGRPSGGLRCERVSFAVGRGICLQADRGVFTTYRAVLFNERLQSRTSFELEGSPSRTRISADGRIGAITARRGRSSRQLSMSTSRRLRAASPGLSACG